MSKKQILGNKQLGLPPEAIKQFQKLCLKKGFKLSMVEATEAAHHSINLVRVLNGQDPLVTLTTN